MTDQEIKDHAFDCGFYGTTPPCLDWMNLDQREIWDAFFEEGRKEEQECAREAMHDYHVQCSIYGYD
jgi:hypothetical protein